jgi:hypothetical protein
MDVSDGIIVSPQFAFASSVPAANKIVISGNGKLLHDGDPPLAVVEGVERYIDYLIEEG